MKIKTGFALSTHQNQHSASAMNTKGVFVDVKSVMQS